MLKTFSSSLLLLSVTILLAQPVKKPQFNTWIFNHDGRIDFPNGGDPVFTDYVFPLSDQGNRASSTYCDNNGDVLFHSDNFRLFDKNNNIMPNGNNLALIGGHKARQGLMVVPFINDPNKYYAFQPTESWVGVPAPRRLIYHVIDMTLPPNGDIVPGQKNITILDSAIESVVGAMHKNGKDYWVISRETYDKGNSFYSWLVTENGICTTPVVSKVGAINKLPWTPGTAQMAVSFDEKQIALTGRGIPAQLFNFDNRTGRLSDARNIANGSNFNEYDVEFSPNDSLIYITSGLPGPVPHKPVIYQYKRFAPDIPSTEVTIGGVLTTDSIKYHYSLRCYGDTIYVASGSGIHLLTNPNNYGDPGLVHNWVYTDNGPVPEVFWSLPHYFDYESNPIPRDTFTLTPQIDICSADAPFGIGNPANPATPEFSYSWSPTTGLDDPTAPNPITDPSLITGSITYTVTVNFLCETYIDTIQVSSKKTDFPITVGIDICEGDSALIFDAFQNVSNTYKDTIDSTCVIRSVKLTVSDIIIINQDTMICEGDSIFMDGTYHKTNTTFHDTTDCIVTITQLIVTPMSSTYDTVTICQQDSALIHGNYESMPGDYIHIGAGGCDTVTTTLIVTPIDTLQDTTTICEGDSFELENTFYTSPGTLFSTIDKDNCSLTQIELIVHPNPIVDFEEVQDDFCDEGIGSVITSLLIGQEPISYRWSNEDSTAIIEGLTAGTYSLTITDGNGCSSTQTIEIGNSCDASPVYLPNTFTPNGDGVNDVFKPYFKNIDIDASSFEFNVFDKWGALIFSTKDVQETWKGFFKNELVPTGVYSYRIQFKEKNVDQELHTYDGIVTLLR